MKELRDDFGALVKASAEMELPAVGAGLERRVMTEIARRAVERSRRRARLGVVASLSGLAMLLAGCIAATVAWFPALLPAFSRMSWLDKLRDIPVPEFLRDTAPTVVGDGVPLFEQWGGLVLIALVIGGVVGFIFYLNGLFSTDYSPDRATTRGRRQ